jgi:hypothetical protein
MNPSVVYQSGLLSEGMPTDSAPIRLLTGMGATVHYQGAQLSKGLRTGITCIRFLATVNAQVVFQCEAAGEGLAACGALEGPLAGVNALMLHEVTWLRERDPACTTDMRSLATVYAHVDLQPLPLGEGLRAFRTSVGALCGMGECMLLEAELPCKCPTTSSTDEGPFPGVAPPVRLELAWHSEALPTGWAFVPFALPRIVHHGRQGALPCP